MKVYLSETKIQKYSCDLKFEQKYNNLLSFKSLGYSPDSYIDKFGILRSTQHTTGIRESELDYAKLAKIIKKRFKNFDRVNIMPMCVSDGMEVYCIANEIIKKEGYKRFQEKYTPIIASDVSGEIIKSYGQQGLLLLNDTERYVFDNVDKTILEEVNKDDYRDFITFQYGEPEHLYKLKPEYKKNFEFLTMDLQTRINNMRDKGNSVVMIRNCLKQSFGLSVSKVIILQLLDKIRGASLLVTGGYDMKNLPELKDFIRTFFIEIEPNIWGLKTYKKPNSIIDFFNIVHSKTIKKIFSKL